MTPKPAARARVAVSANDSKVVLVNGVVTVVPRPAPDTIAVIDLSVAPPRVVAEVEVPNSVVGPPSSVAITPDEGLALVTSAMTIDPAGTGGLIPDNRLSVVDLRARPPAVVATLRAGTSPSGLSINRQGTLALVANRGDGTVSVFGISGPAVRPLGTVMVGGEKCGVCHVAISPDGTTALATRDGDDRISVLSIDGTRVEATGREVYAGLRPYGIDISRDGSLAVVANIGRGGGDADTISVIDMRARPVRVVDTITVGQTPEGIGLSPDGTLCGVVVMNGSNKPRESPFFADHGRLVLFHVRGLTLVPAGEAPIGHWSQGLAFSTDNRTILVGNMVEKDVQVLSWDGASLTDTGHRLPMRGGSAALRTADTP